MIYLCSYLFPQTFICNFDLIQLFYHKIHRISLIIIKNYLFHFIKTSHYIMINSCFSLYSHQIIKNLIINKILSASIFLLHQYINYRWFNRNLPLYHLVEIYQYNYRFFSIIYAPALLQLQLLQLFPLFLSNCHVGQVTKCCIIILILPLVFFSNGLPQ